MKVADIGGAKNLSQILDHIYKTTKNQTVQTDKNRYQVLFVITDGIISDLSLAVDGIIRCSKLPISIIFLGVGSSNFSELEKFDDRLCKLQNNKGKSAKRCNVQFAALDRFNSVNELLTRLLKRVSIQVSEYFSSKLSEENKFIS